MPTNGIQRVTFCEIQQKQNNYGAARKPYNRTRGKIEYDGSIALFLDVVWTLIKSAPNGRIQDIPPFEIIHRVSFGAESRTYELKYCEFMENGIDLNEGDMNVVVELPIIIGDVVYKKGI